MVRARAGVPEVSVAEDDLPGVDGERTDYGVAVLGNRDLVARLGKEGKVGKEARAKGASCLGVAPDGLAERRDVEEPPVAAIGDQQVPGQCR